MTEKKAKKSFLKGIKQEFKRIVWPTKKETIDATVLVIAAIVAFSVLIKVIDVVIRFLLSLAI